MQLLYVQQYVTLPAPCKNSPLMLPYYQLPCKRCVGFMRFSLEWAKPLRTSGKSLAQEHQTRATKQTNYPKSKHATLNCSGYRTTPFSIFLYWPLDFEGHLSNIEWFGNMIPEGNISINLRAWWTSNHQPA